MTRSPVLFMVFNRPHTTRQVFEAIRAAEPPRLYVAADGPRASRPEELERCEEVRRIATAVDWPCDIRMLLRDSNLGCRNAVSSAITWFFEHESEGIVLEDDCLPHPSFFDYCDALLERYRDDPRVGCIGGVNFVSRAWTPEASYYFSRYAHIWGWATWRRAWRNYDVTMADWRAGRTSGLLEATFPDSARERRFWRRNFDQVASGKIDTWDYQWAHACWQQGALTCLPRENLISNIGFGADATHTLSAESKMANLPVGEVPLPLLHPAQVSASEIADRWSRRHVFEIDDSLMGLVQWGQRVKRRLHTARRAMGVR